jgi:hypothetical protein
MNPFLVTVHNKGSLGVVKKNLCINLDRLNKFVKANVDVMPMQDGCIMFVLTTLVGDMVHELLS